MARRILIVDADPVFLREAGEILAGAGYSVDPVADGAKALEAALAGKPDLIFTNYHLPVFSGERLRSFLRNNPTTFHIPFLFLVDADRARDASLASLGQVGVLVKPVGREDLLRRIGEAFGDAKAERRPARGGEAGVEGNLRDVSLVDLTQIFSLNRRTGILTVSDAELEGQVYFRNGEVVSCQLGSARGEKAFFRMLHWKEGTFRYAPGDHSVSRDISRGSDALLMEGLRQLDEWGAIASKMPPNGSLLTQAKNPDDLPNELRPVTQEVLLLLEFYDRVEDIVDKCSYTDYEICRTVIGLIQKGIIEVATSARAPGRAGGPLLTADQALAVCSRLGRDERSHLGYGTGRLLVFADPPELVRDFLSRASEIPEFTLSRDNFSNQEVLSFSFGTLGNVLLSESAYVSLFLLPCRKDALPAWKPFSEGSLGAIILSRPGEEGEGPGLARALVSDRLALPVLDAAPGGDGAFHPADILSRFFALMLEREAARSGESAWGGRPHG